MTAAEKETRRELIRRRVLTAKANGQEFEPLLIAKRAQLVEELLAFSSEVKDGLSSTRPAGGNDLADRAQTETVVPAETCAGKCLKMIGKIDEALRRIKIGTYGICKDCGEPIGRKRLLATIFADRCVSCKEGVEFQEKRLKGGKGTSRRYDGAHACA